MTFKLYLQNARSIRGKLADFTQGLLLHNYDVVALCETWLLDSIMDSEVSDYRYDVHRRDRPVHGGLARRGAGGGVRSVGGGVMLLTRRTLGARALAAPIDAPYDMVHVIIRARVMRAARDLHIICVYLPGSGASHDAQVTNLTVFLREFMDKNSNADYLLMGDFNFPYVEWHVGSSNLPPLFPLNVTNEYQRDLLQTLSSFNLEQYNTVINGNSRYLDLVFGTLEVATTRCTHPLTREDMPHHPAIDLEMPNIILYKTLRDPKIRVYKFKKANYDVIRSRLATVDWANKLNGDGIDDTVLSFLTELRRVIKEEVPSFFSDGCGYPIWFSKPLINIIKEKAKYHMAWKKYGNKLDYDAFSLLRQRQKTVQQECWIRYIDGCETAITTNPKHFWSYTRSLRRDKGIPVQVTHGDRVTCGGSDICNAFLEYFFSVYRGPNTTHRPSLAMAPSNLINTINSIQITQDLVLKYLRKLDRNKGAGSDGIPSFFVKQCAKELATPLTAIFRRSMSEGVYPTIWKEAYITPIHKGGSRQNVENYRPVSILSVFGKVFESIVHDQLYPVAAAYIPISQHGFMRRRSTVSNLAVFTNFITQHMDKGGQVDAVYTDYSKCFDRIDHDILISKLNDIGVHGDLLRWLESYIRNRSQAVRIGAFKSNMESVPSGVPQGSHLGPLLFNIYLYDIDICFKYSNVLMYADDNKIFMPIRCAADCERLQADLDRLTDYCRLNRLDLNVKKCQVITFTRKRIFLSHIYHLNDTCIPRVELVRDLGVILDYKLLYTSHFDFIAQKSYRMLGFLHRSAKSFRRIESLKKLYFAYVRSVMEYAAPIWSPSYVTHIAQLESVQRCFTRRLHYRLKREDGYLDRLNFYQLDSLEVRRLMSDMKFLYDVVNSILDCPELTACIGLCACPIRTRHMRSLCTTLAHSNYAKHSVLQRIVRTYEDRFRDVDIFHLNRTQFLNILKDHPQFRRQ